ncbi:MAG: YiiX/YebB-like N1pC/P60 family cysteine hydrolase [Cyanobacteria bacterium J06632_3]
MNLVFRSAIIVSLIVLSFGLERWYSAADVDGSTVGEWPEPMAGATSNVAPSLDLGTPPLDSSRTRDRLEPGDIVFRTRNDWMAQVAQRFGSTATYSHVGVITTQDDQLWVVYAPLVRSIGPQQKDAVVKTTLSDYLSQERPAQAVVYRLKHATDDMQQAIAVAALDYAKQTADEDDNMFNLKAHRQANCSGLIRKVYSAAQLDEKKQTEVLPALFGLSSDVPLEKACLTPDVFSSHQDFRLVYPL